MSGGGCTRGAKPPRRVDPNISRPPARAAVLPTHTVSPGDGATASSHLSMAPVVAIVLCTLVTIAAILFLSFFGSWMGPVVSIDGVTATGLDAAGAAGNATTTTISPSFDVAVRVKMQRFHLAPGGVREGLRRRVVRGGRGHRARRAPGLPALRHLAVRGVGDGARRAAHHRAVRRRARPPRRRAAARGGVAGRVRVVPEIGRRPWLDAEQRVSRNVRRHGVARPWEFNGDSGGGGGGGGVHRREAVAKPSHYYKSR
ncbi:Os10g0487100 [Oryza sativa Japonica Group]|uniref:Os10g0487100 protein n=3 Tax=Oryza sativa subsp. japonica TaxID=39947 RepID=A0A0N7KRZ5_ORYSJ|nr:Os10g0487100 [Oryza sativa Japonica Group]